MCVDIQPKLGDQAESRMVPWWKRLAFSFVSVLIAAIASGLILGLSRLFAGGGADSPPDNVLWSIWPVLVMSLPGWLLATPIVLLASSFRGWRLWFFLLVGTALGPVLILSFTLVEQLTGLDRSGFWANRFFVALAAVVSTTATLIHILLMRRAQAERPLN